MVVAYRTSELTYRLAKRLARVNFISLPNLLLDRACVPELIQHDCTATRLLEATEKGLEGQLKGFDDLRNALGESGAAQALAQRVAKVFGEGSEPHH
jgi:lipid-A-disaccharide synthase